MKKLQLITLFWCLLLAFLSNAALAQEPSPERREYDKVFAEWQGILDSMRNVQAEAEISEDDQLPALQERYDSLIEQGNELIPQLRKAAMDVYASAPNQDREITRWLVSIAGDYVGKDLYEEAQPVLQVLLDGKCEDKSILDLAGKVAFALHDFENAKEHLAEAAAAGTLSPQASGMLADVDKYVEFWAEEQKLREEEANLPDDQQLPRVELETSKGKIVLELFENEAPETVGNFVSLVEKGFYDGLTFHRVLPGFMAQGGCPEGTGMGGPGYKIYCECYQDTYRKHFRGSLSMAKGGRDSGGSQFFLTFTPTPHLNGRHTVFGRIIEGIEVLPKLQRRDPENSEDLAKAPDKILKARVLRKRDHKYVPHKVR